MSPNKQFGISPEQGMLQFDDEQPLKAAPVYPNFIEISDGYAMDEDGNVRPPSDDPDYEDAEALLAPEYDTLEEMADDETEETNSIRALAPFDERNAHLASAAGYKAMSNRAAGAYEQIASGNNISKFRSAQHAGEVRDTHNQKAREQIAMACGACALREHCDMAEGDLLAKLSDPSARNRFVKRVEKPDNNRFCETNFLPGRINKDLA